jgi:hypothetical protein
MGKQQFPEFYRLTNLALAKARFAPEIPLRSWFTPCFEGLNNGIGLPGLCFCHEKDKALACRHEAMWPTSLGVLGIGSVSFVEIMSNL